jgi:hypothetical protein
MANPKAEAEKRKRESEKKALDREKLTLAQGKEKLKLSQDAKKAKLTLVARQKRERLAMKETKKLKEDWIEDELIDKLLSRNRVRAVKIFNAMSKREKMKYLEAVQTITSRLSHGVYSDDDVVDALDDHGIDISKKARKTWEETEIQQEADRMHSYVNTLSLERSVNLWAEAAKAKEEGKDPEPVSGSKTLTKKSQNKITINPMEKEPQNRSA